MASGNRLGKAGRECCQVLAKGRSVYVEGRLQTRSWDDKDGQKRYATEIIADSVQFLGGGAKDGNYEPAPPLETPPDYKHQSLDDIPF
jgi:single-strand DNA-binding protein